METEHEAKWLDIDPAGIRDNLHKLGARLVHPERLMQRRVFDFYDLRLDQQGAWLEAKRRR